MAELEIKKKLLLKFLPDLQCYHCKDIPGPGPMNSRRSRYACFEQSHFLCLKHNVKCPCGSAVEKMPSPSVARFLKDMPWMCHNYRNGCREIKLDAEKLDQHEKKCIFRRVFCPHWFCRDKTGTNEVMFKNITNHLIKFMAMIVN